MKQNQFWNHDDSRIERGIAGARSEAVDASAVPSVVSSMLSVGRPRPRLVSLRFATVAVAAAAFGLIVLYPKTSAAATLKQVDSAVKAFPARYERVYRPDAQGKLSLQIEFWGEPGKYAYRSVDGSESRHDGNVSYSYWPELKMQKVEVSEGMEMDPVGVDTYAQFKLLRVQKEKNGLLRYVFSIHQDLLVDPVSQLPVERDVYWPDGRLLEVHEYHFMKDLDDKLFQPDIKPGVVLHDISQEQEAVGEALRNKPQTVVVDGLRVNLYAVFVGSNGEVSAVVNGGDPRPLGIENAMEVIGLPKGFCQTRDDSTTYGAQVSKKPGEVLAREVPARIERVYFGKDVKIPEQFRLRIPVWRYDPNVPLLNPKTKEKLGINSRIVGWAEFKVDAPLHIWGVDRCLPGAKSTEGVAQTGSTK